MKTHVHPRLVASITLLALLLALAACAEQRVVEPLRAARAQAPTAQPSETLTAPADTSAQQAGGGGEHSRDCLHVEQPGSYSISFTNDGGIPHDVTFPDGTKIVANAKETKTAVVDVPASGSANSRRAALLSCSTGSGSRRSRGGDSPRACARP